MLENYVTKIGACGEALYIYRKEDTYINGWGFLHAKPGKSYITVVPVEDSFSETIEIARAAITTINAVEKARKTSKVVAQKEQLLNVA